MVKTQAQIDNFAKLILKDPVLLDMNLKTKARLLKLMTYHQVVNQNDVKLVEVLAKDLAQDLTLIDE
jgi:uncharacterized protein with PIN domain